MEETYKEYVRIPKFMGGQEDDFDLWSLRIMATMEAKDYHGLLTREDESPPFEEAEAYTAWYFRMR